MGLLDDYGIDSDTIPDGPNFDVADDIYEFEIGDVHIQNGTSKDPEQVSIVFDYLLGEEGKRKSEWFRLPKDASAPTDKELQSLSFYKTRLLSLGVPREEINAVGADDLIGRTGTLQVFTKNGYQNIKNVKVGEVEAAPAPKVPAARGKAAPVATTAVKNPFAK